MTGPADASPSPGDAAWDDALARYARPGAREACLELQDRFGVDVPTLLVAAWAAERLGVSDPATVAAMAARTREWAQSVVAPIRAARRAAKADGSAPDLVARLAEVELEAERLMIDRLAGTARAAAPADPPGDAAAERLTRLVAGWLPRLLDDPHAVALVGTATGVAVHSAC